MEQSKYQSKILKLIDQLVYLLEKETPQLTTIQTSVHKLFEYASLDTAPITLEKQDTLKTLINKLHEIEKKDHFEDKKALIQALYQMKSAYL